MKIIHMAFIKNSGRIMNLCNKKLSPNPNTYDYIWKKVTCKRCFKMRPKNVRS